MNKMLSLRYTLSLCTIISLCFLTSIFGLLISPERALSLPSSNRTDNNLVDCMDPTTHPGVQPTSFSDCNSALLKIIEQPGFLNKWWFSRNWRFGIQVPKLWKSENGECTILVSCGNDYDRDRFTYRDVLHAAKHIIKECIEERPETRYGGLELIGSLGSFYVAVGKQTVNPAVRLGHRNGSEVATA